MMQIEIMPNTGHHFFRVEGNKDSWKSLDIYVKNRLYEKFKQNRSWSVPTNGKDKSVNWIRWRVIPSKSGIAQVPHLEVVVESNLGGNTRGVLLKGNEPVAHRTYLGQPDAPYAFKEASDIEKIGGFKFGVNLASLLSQDDHDDLGIVKPECQLSSLPPPIPGSNASNNNISDNPLWSDFFVFEINWPTSMASNPIPVDLIVDFGNTRTVALLLEESPGTGLDGINSLKQRIRPLDFGSRGSSAYSESISSSIIDSWFVLQEPQFSANEYPEIPADSIALKEYLTETIPAVKTRFGAIKEAEKLVVSSETTRLPQMFVELSPVVVGRDAVASLWALKIEGGGVSFLSSPKRYIWEDRVDNGENGINQLVWTMVRNNWNPENSQNQNATLRAPVLRFFPQSGEDWNFSNPPIKWSSGSQPAADPVRPVYPRSDALAWMALGVVEAAWRKINTQDYWRNHHPYVPRFLRSVQVTHPSGWTDQEIAAYRRKWEKAINIFTLGHFAEGAQPPELSFPIDEAVAAQLPIIFSDINRTGGNGENFIELFGRKLKQGDSSKRHKARVMSIDIGGGTTDYAIVEYCDNMSGSGVELTTELLFRDSVSVAGDAIVKEILEQVFLRILSEKWNPDSEERQLFESFFSESFNNQNEQETWKKICRLALVPRAVSWLEDLCQGREINQTNRREDGSTIMDDSSAGLSKLNSLWEECCSNHGITPEPIFESASFELPTTVSKENIEDVVMKVMDPIIADLSKFVYAYDVDLVIVSGKPSEIPIMRNLVETTLPITNDRVVFVRDYKAGEWYPFSRLKKISDAKTVTAVGLALYQSIIRGQVPDWSIRPIHSKRESRRHYWLKLPAHANQEPEVLLEAKSDTSDCILLVNSRIGRSFLSSSQSPEPTYIVAWKGQGRPPTNRIKITLAREVPQNGDSEILKIQDASSTDDNTTIDARDLELRVCTLSGSDYWLDSPRFEIKTLS